MYLLSVLWKINYVISIHFFNNIFNSMKFNLLTLSSKWIPLLIILSCSRPYAKCVIDSAWMMASLCKMLYKKRQYVNMGSRSFWPPRELCLSTVIYGFSRPPTFFGPSRTIVGKALSLLFKTINWVPKFGNEPGAHERAFAQKKKGQSNWRKFPSLKLPQIGSLSAAEFNFKYT